jgi:hypothetical protein
MKNFPVDRRSPLGLFPGEPTPRLYDRVVEVLRTQHWRFLVVPTGKGFMQVRLNESWRSQGGARESGLGM